MKERKAQIWIETVIYTLIGITVIGMLLAFAKPKIDSMKDRSIIEQTMSSFNELNKLIYEVQERGPENSRQIQIKISKGSMIIDPVQNKISWIIDPLSYKYSEPGFVVSSGDLKLNTTSKGNSYSIEIFKNYPVNITANGNYYKKEIATSSNLYTLIIKNKGIVGGNILIDITS